MDTTSLWKAISNIPTTYPELESDIKVDVLIIGGGITGVTTAFQLMNSGKSIAIVEADYVGGKTTSYSSSNLYIPVQPYYQNIVKKFNLETAKAIAQSRQFAIDFIEQTVKQKKINCQFSRRPWFIYTHEDDKLKFLDKEIDTFKQMDVAINEVRDLPFPFKFKKAAVIDNQARFNCFQYVLDLAFALHKQGCQIFENSRVKKIDEQDDICYVHTDKAKITANKVVVATHTPINVDPTQLYTAPYRSYAVTAFLKNDSYPEGHFWDLSHPHHATCTHSTNGDKPNLLLVAGNHHKVGQKTNTLENFEGLRRFLNKYFNISQFHFQWSAQHYHSADDVPYIGLRNRFSKHVYSATGFFADGLVYGTIAGVIIADLILDKNNKLEELYKSTRFKPLSSAGFIAKENSNVFLQYLKDYPLSAKYQDIGKGQAKVVEIGREKCGVYRDENNELHIVSAVCTHMKCIVDWNNAEKTWDCPCHGSRFTKDGKVIEGPATRDLQKRKE